MNKVSDPETALRHIKHYGYLNAFETPADSWYEASDTPMEASEHVGELIGSSSARRRCAATSTPSRSPRRS